MSGSPRTFSTMKMGLGLGLLKRIMLPLLTARKVELQTGLRLVVKIRVPLESLGTLFCDVEAPDHIVCRSELEDRQFGYPGRNRAHLRGLQRHLVVEVGRRMCRPPKNADGVPDGFMVLFPDHTQKYFPKAKNVVAQPNGSIEPWNGWIFLQGYKKTGNTRLTKMSRESAR